MNRNFQAEVTKRDPGAWRIFVRGSNDIGSAVALHLFQAGYRVIIHDIPLPTVTRRKMAFADAIFEGSVHWAGVQAIRVDEFSHLEDMLTSSRVLPVLVADFDHLLNAYQPQVLIDARMRKHQQPETQRSLAALTIGLGPNFIAGENVDIAIETSWGDALGHFIFSGPTRPLEGEPRALGGHARDRYVYAPQAGLFRSAANIGDDVQQGQVIAWVDSIPLQAPLTGRLRGLTHTGVPVTKGTKVIEVDPRGENAEISGIAERPKRIAEGVLRAISVWTKNELPKG